MTAPEEFKGGKARVRMEKDRVRMDQDNQDRRYLSREMMIESDAWWEQILREIDEQQAEDVAWMKRMDALGSPISEKTPDGEPPAFGFGAPTPVVEPRHRRDQRGGTDPDDDTHVQAEEDAESEEYDDTTYASVTRSYERRQRHGGTWRHRRQRGEYYDDYDHLDEL